MNFKEKQYQELRKRYRENMKSRTEIKKRIENGTFQLSDYDILQGITLEQVKRQVGIPETWEEKMDREAEEMFEKLAEIEEKEKQEAIQN